MRMTLLLIAMTLCGCEGFQESAAPAPARNVPATRDVPQAEAKGPAALESAGADARREAALDLTKSRLADEELRGTVARKLAVMAQGDPDSLVRSAALQALLKQHPVLAVNVARNVRTDTSAVVRWDAAKILSELGGAPLVGALIEMLSGDPDENVRREAAKGLSRYDEPRVIHALIAALDDEDLSVAHASRDSLVKLSAGVDLGMKREAWEKWWK